MSKRIFWGIFLVTVIIFAACLALVIGVDYRSYVREHEEKVREETGYIVKGVEQSGLAYLGSLTDNAELRITWIDKDGTVLFDSSADAATMENHADREEVRQALAEGVGESSRRSGTLSEHMIYYAVKAADGTVVRTATTEKSLLSRLDLMIRPTLLILAAAVALSLLLAYRISRSIIRPINAIDFEHPERSRVYRELHPLLERISHQNSIIAKQMDELRTEHEAREKMRREFTANVSHELKTPLTSVSGFAEIMRNGMVKNEDLTRFAGYIYDETQRLISLVGDIIKLSQLDDNELPVEKVRLDLYDACEAVLATLKPSADARGVALELRGQHACIYGAEQIIDEIIYNLCDNAVKYNKENGKVTVSVDKRGNEVHLTVSDTGIGIPEADQPRVFERFYRVNKSQSKQMGGTGLGLSIVKHGAAYHNARIVLTSVPGEGTTVKILFRAEGWKPEQIW